MNIKNLQFFDYNGYNLNFELSEFGYWEGTIYLSKPPSTMRILAISLLAILL